MTRRRSVADQSNASHDHSNPTSGLTDGCFRTSDRDGFQPNVAAMVTAPFTGRSALRLSDVRTSPPLVTVITPAYNVGPWIG